MKFKGVFLAAVLAAVVCVSGNVFAALSGGGTPTNPYLIQSRADFDEFANPANAATYWSSGKYTKLMCDLSLAGTTYTQAVIAPDTSTTSGFQGTQFNGVFDGNSHIISNLTINGPAQSFTVGLFGYVGANGQIRNLGVKNVNITGGGNAGGMAGHIYYGTLTSCYATGSVSGTGYGGGLVGQNYHGTLTSCYSTVSVSGAGYGGGLVGLNNTYGTLTSCYSTGSVSGTSYIGGLVGMNNTYGTLTSCYSTGSVDGGGLWYSAAGGLVADNSGAITFCYSTGLVSNAGSVGGLAVHNYGGTITACFWDTQTSGQTGSAYLGGTGKTTADMMTLSTFTSANWDFSVTDGDPADWMMLWSGKDYPRLAWQPVFTGDLNNDRTVNFSDFAHLAKSWFNACSEPNWCEGADIDRSGAANYNDMVILANDWLRTYYLLSASVLSGNGTVSPSSKLYPEGTVAVLTAVPYPSYKFKAWNGTDNDLSKSTTNTVTMNSNKEVTVEFELIPYYQLNTSVVGGNGSISPSSQQYLEGTIVTLTATPLSSYIVKAWHGTNNDFSNSITNTVTMSSNKNVTVEFEEDTNLLPNGGFEMGDFTYWTPSGGQFYIYESLTEGAYAAYLHGNNEDGGLSTLSRTVNLPGYGDYTISFAYRCGGDYARYAYVQINDAYYDLNANGSVYTFTRDFFGINSFTIQFVANNASLVIDNCTIVNCFDCHPPEPECGDLICDPSEEYWCPDCGPIGPPF